MRSIRNVDKPDGTPESGSVEEEINSIASKYEGKSEAELMSALMSTVSAAKRDGSFSDEQLDDFVGFVSPSLDADARAKLDSLVRMIKGG